VRERVIVGLGNPGKKYEMTRHNLGFMAVQALANQEGWHFKTEARFQSVMAKGVIQDTAVTLLLPMTYMNESGAAVKAYFDYCKLPLDALVVAADDVDLPFEVIRLRPHGGTGGHNGLKSIEASLGTKYYIRLRLGIGRADTGGGLADYVLDTFSSEELAALPALIDRAAAALKLIITADIAQAMQAVNAKIKSVGEQKNERTQTEPL
jgi:peptidyl-tRNA hydrolase, PTH1 family